MSITKNMNMDDAKRGGEVRFNYTKRRKVIDVKGTVDIVTRSAIYVGNETRQESDYVSIFHTKKYLRGKIENFEIL